MENRSEIPSKSDIDSPETKGRHCQRRHGHNLQEVQAQDTGGYLRAIGRRAGVGSE